MYRIVTLEEARSSSLRQFYAYWQQKRGDRALPAKSNIDPAEIKDILPYLIIAEVFDHPLRVRYRLVGTEIVKLRGREFTGKWLHEVQWNPVFLERLIREYRALIDSRQPLLGVDDLYSADGPSMDYEWGMFPLADDGEHVSHCLAIEDHREMDLDVRGAPASTWMRSPLGCGPAAALRRGFRTRSRGCRPRDRSWCRRSFPSCPPGTWSCSCSSCWCC